MTAEPMPASELAEIKARREALRQHLPIGDLRYDGSDAVLIFPADGGMAETVATVWGGSGSDEETAIGEFIGHAPTDTDALVAEVERLRCTDPIECGHEAALGQAEAELARRDHEAAEALADQTLMKGLTVKDKKTVLSLIPPREIAELWVHCARGMLGDAPNYSETPVEMEVGLAGERERFALIVQRVGKTTPHEAREQAETERDRLRHALERAALSVEHDRASRACQERITPIHNEDCPACDVAAALNPEQVAL